MKTPVPPIDASSNGKFDIDRVRENFPILTLTVQGKPLTYLDNAATTQKPRAVIDAIGDYYLTSNANVHRGVHHLSAIATEGYEAARESVRLWINAAQAHEIVFTRGTTESVNLVAGSFGRATIHAGDEIVISTMEHHSNLVPWQLLCEEKGALLRAIPITDDGEIELSEYEKLLNEKTKLICLAHVSNSLGTVNPIKRMIATAHEFGIPVLIDGAQAVPHFAVDVRALDCDFYAFSGHKMFGPTGIGVLYGKEAHLERMPPYQGGGDMIRSVTLEKTTFNSLPYKFEAGTPHIAGAFGLRAAIRFLAPIGFSAIEAYERELVNYALTGLSAMPRVQIVGRPRCRAGVISFLCGDIHPHDIATVLDHHGIAIRAGHHCTQPLMQRLGLAATARVSLAFYNTREEIDRLLRAIPEVIRVFG